MNSRVLETLSAEVKATVEPLERVLSEQWRALHLLRHLGFTIDLASLVDEDLVEFVAAVQTLRGAIQEALDEIGDGDPGERVHAILTAVEVAWPKIQELSGGADELNRKGFAIALEDVLDGPALETALEDLVAAMGRLPHYLVRRRLEQAQPMVLVGLRGLGLVDRTDDAAVEVFRLDRLEAMLDDTPGAIATLYQWGPAQTWDAPRLLRALSTAMIHLGMSPDWSDVPWAWREGSDPWVSGTGESESVRVLKLPLIEKQDATGWTQFAAGLTISPFPSTGPTAKFDALMLAPWSTFDGTFETESWRFTTPNVFSDPKVGLLIAPSGVSIRGSLPDSYPFGVESLVPWTLGDEENPSLEVEGFRASLVVAGGTDGDPGRFTFDAGTPPMGITLALEFADAPEFITAVIGKGATIRGGVAFGYDSVDGWTLELGAGWRVDSPGKIPIGPLTVTGLAVEIGITAQDLRASVVAGLVLNLKVLTLGVHDIGAELVLDWTGEGSLGPFDLRTQFRPPQRVELSVNAGPVSGGGYLAWSPGRYEGVLELGVSLGMKTEPTAPGEGGAGEPEALSEDESPPGLRLVALGIITTGKPWSLLTLIAATGMSVDVGFGFALTGIGGLLALNRDMDVNALEAAVPTGGLKAVLFPQNVVEQAPQILSALDRFFPQSPGRFTGGLFVQLTWGTDELWVTELGIILSLPRPIKVALIGSSTVKKLNGDKEVFKIRLDVLGYYDGSVPEVAISAALVDSHIAGLPFAGGAYFRWRGGSEPDFILTIGGYHPAFDPPPGTRVPERLGFMLETGLLFLSLQAYIALTPNTFQFGSHVMLRAEALGFVIDGRFGFDVLIRFRPFGLQADLYASLSLATSGGRTIASISAAGQLVGPKPWRFRAEVEVSILGAKIRGEVEGTFGTAGPDEKAAEAVDVRDAVREALADQGAWDLVRTRASDLVPREGLEDLVVLPGDQLVIAQGIVPLGVDVEHFHAQPVLDHAGNTGGSVSIDVVEPSGITVTPTEKPFAPASWQIMTDSQRLSTRSFLPGKAGVALAATTAIQGDSTPGDAGAVQRDAVDPWVANGDLALTSRPAHTPVRRSVAQ